MRRQKIRKISLKIRQEMIFLVQGGPAAAAAEHEAEPRQPDRGHHAARAPETHW